jgi:NAD(P)-dependent dehydrogenase (short-subunit alcohol dehydrogenase family)
MSGELYLDGMRAVVTGGSRGIGEAIVRALHGAGGRVAINYHSSAERASDLAEELNGRRPDSARAFAADVSNPADVAGLFEAVDDWLGGVDVLVNNAGFEDCHHLLDLPFENWRNVLDTNLTGAFLCTQQAGRRMEAQFRAAPTSAGVIVNLSSIHDAVPRKGFAHYSAAKAGVAMLTKATALELAECNVRAVTVAPGAIRTDMNREEIAAFGEHRFREWIPLARVGETDDVAQLVAFLCGPHAAYVTGSSLYVDGGYMQGLVQYDPRPPR